MNTVSHILPAAKMFSKFGACALLRYNRGACAVHQLQQRARQLSTKPQVAPGAVRRTLRFLYQNKQSLINIVAMYFVLSMALHQMRVKVSACEREGAMAALVIPARLRCAREQKAWDEREEEYEQLKATSSKVEANLTSDEWLHVRVALILYSKPGADLVVVLGHFCRTLPAN